jgi:hypothetical protein
MPFVYYRRLSAARKRVYRESDAITRLDLPTGVDPGAPLARLRDRLAADDRPGVQRAAQAIVDALVDGYRVPPVRVVVQACRPVDKTGQLYGLYRPESGAAARITVWMRTAARRQVVAFKTFLRTLVHELCHHLDYDLFKLADSFHTEGFYSRESALTAALLAREAVRRRADAATPSPQLPLF